MLALVLCAGGPLAGSSAVEARAQLPLPRPRLEIAPYAGGFFTGDVAARELADRPIVGARAGVRLPGGVALEGQLGYASLEIGGEGRDADAGEIDLTAWLYEAGLAWHLPLPGPLTPFLGIAAGAARLDPDLEIAGEELGAETALAASGGVGARLSLGGWGLRADLREHLLFDALEETNAALSEGEGKGETIEALEISLGISWLF